ncbi:MAG: universal stress protein [Candidatus Nanopelagicales bacterium]
MDGSAKVMVLGDDGSVGADAAWEWVTLQRWPGWSVQVLAARIPRALAPRPDLAVPHPWTPPTPRVADPRTEIADVVHLTAADDPRLALHGCSDADLLVIGPRGVGRLAALVLGSTAEWLMHHPPAPLVIVRAPKEVRRVLVCLDGSIHAERALDALLTMPWISGCSVTLLAHGDATLPDPLPVTAAAADRVAPHAAAVEQRPVPIDPTSLFFNVRAAILDTIEELQPELVVMGTRGLGPLKRLQLGSTASAITRLAPCSVLLVRAADTEDDTAAG